MNDDSLTDFIGPHGDHLAYARRVQHPLLADVWQWSVTDLAGDIPGPFAQGTCIGAELAHLECMTASKEKAA